VLKLTKLVFIWHSMSSTDVSDLSGIQNFQNFQEFLKFFLVSELSGIPESFFSPGNEFLFFLI